MQSQLGQSVHRKGKDVFYQIKKTDLIFVKKCYIGNLDEILGVWHPNRLINCCVYNIMSINNANQMRAKIMLYRCI